MGIPGAGPAPEYHETATAVLPLGHPS